MAADRLHTGRNSYRLSGESIGADGPANAVLSKVTISRLSQEANAEMPMLTTLAEIKTDIGCIRQTEQRNGNNAIRNHELTTELTSAQRVGVLPLVEPTMDSRRDSCSRV
jgi:hypothetical protein